MARWIDADKLKEYVWEKSSHMLCEWDTAEVLVTINRQETADVRPERHGAWIYQKPDDAYTYKPWRCSNCGLQGGKHQTAYCPHCGTKMDGQKGENK